VRGALPALTFQVGREAFALDIRRVREAVPRVRPWRLGSRRVGPPPGPAGQGRR
jgi:hypothetical protein